MKKEMLSGYNIIYFGPEKWEGMWRNRHQLMSRFARCNKVLYVEPVIDVRGTINRLKEGFLAGGNFWKDIFKKPVTRVSDNLYIYHSPLYLPVSGRFPFDKISWWIWKAVLKTVLKQLGFSYPVIWLSRPDMKTYIESFNEKLLIYHVVDEYSAYGNLTVEGKQKVQLMEQEIIKRADLVIVVSKQLYDSKKAYNENMYIVPNGVDFESYDRALSGNLPLPADIATLSRPIIGYSGLISKRLDLDIIEHLALSHPEWSIVLMGAIDSLGCESMLSRLMLLKNIHFLGMKNITHVPYYVKAFDVCLVPYAINEETANLSPLKLYDFMATGKPIVTTNFPVAQEFSGLIYIADSKEACTRHIESALLETNEALSEERRHVASQNTWEHRVKQLSRLMGLRLSRHQ